MVRRFGFLYMFAIACGSAPPPAAHVALAPPTHVTPPTELAIPHELPEAYATGWKWWEAGKTNDGLRAFRYVVATLLEKGDPNPRRHSRERLKTIPLEASESVADGDRTLTLTETGVILGDARKHVFERFIEMPSAYQAELATSGLAAVTGTNEVAMIDLASGAVVSRVALESGTVIHGKSRFLVYGASDAGFTVDVWDAASRTSIRTLHDASLSSAMFVSFADDDRAIAIAGEHSDVFDLTNGEKILTYQGPPAIPSVPAFSPDGRFVAYGTVDFEKNPLLGTTYLFDRRAKKVAATTHAMHFPTGFAFSGKWLAVGDLRMGCLFEFPQLRRVACSREIRPHYGPDDDLQETTPTFVASGSALALQTGDGSMLVVRVPSMATIWKGRARLEGDKLVDSDGSGGSWTIGKDGVPVAAPALASDAAPSATVPACRVGTWIFPAAACTFTK